MDIGIPREKAHAERRVAITPAGADRLVRRGHRVFIERSAGAESHFADEEYLSSGAVIAYDTEEVFGRADLLLKVAAPTPEEYELLREEQILMCNLRPAVGSAEGFGTLIERRISAFASELVEDSAGDTPVLHAVSEIAGPMSVQIASHLLESSSGGRGILLGGAPGIAPATVVIIGAGVVGVTAAGAALAAGAEVTVLDHNVKKLRNVYRRFESRVTTMLADRFHVQRSVEFADVLIGAVLIRGDRTPHLVTEEMIRAMKPGSVAIDVSIDQGGCFETSQPTSIHHPTYVRHDVVHYAVPNMTANVARTATYALSHSAVPFILEIAGKGLADACAANHGLCRGLITSQGSCFHPPAAHRFQVPLEDPLQVVLGLREAR